MLTLAATLLWAVPAPASTYVVNNNSDFSDATPGNDVCGVGANCSLRAAIEESNAHAGALTTAAPASAAPTINGSIAYTSYELYTVNEDATNHTQITRGARTSYPDFSPDGRRIALVSSREVYVIDADGSRERRLTRADKPTERPIWSADGSRIFFLTERDNDFDGSEIYSVAPDGSDETLLATNARPLDSFATLATAADKIVYLTETSEVAVMNTDGTGAQTLEGTPGPEDHPIVSPDATTIAFDGAEGGVYSMTITGADVTRLTTTGASVADFSPDGERIAFTQYAGRPRAAVMNVDGSGVVVVSGPKDSHVAAEFSPDSRSITMAELLPQPGEDPYYRLLVAAADGRSAPRTLGFSEAGEEAFSWQALSARAPEPKLKLKVERRRSKPGGGPRVRVTCSNECRVVLRAKVRAGGKKLRSRASSRLFGDKAGTLPALSRKDRRRLDGRRGRIAVKVRVRNDFGARASARLRLRLTA